MKLSNWMSKIPDNVNLKDINIPGTHDASTRFCQFPVFSRCQRKSIPSQLAAGVRALDLRVDGEYMVHSYSKCKTASGKLLTVFRVIDDIYDFLENNPTETVMVFFKNDGKISGDECFEVLTEIINKNKEKWFLHNDFPVLKDVRGKIVLINRVNSQIGINFSKMPYQGNRVYETGESFFINATDKVILQDICTVTMITKWKKAVLPMFENFEKYKNDFVFNHLSTAGFPLIPAFNAKYINFRFLKYSLVKGAHYGTVMVDFITAEICEKIIKTNF